jgi:GPH family glycoside/pentoside/hexuronide:cation symporter
MNNSKMIAYSLLAFCLAFIGLPIYIYLPSYYTDNFALSLESIALIILCTRLFDAFSDPLIGLLSDKFIKFRQKIICYLAPLLGLSFLLLFYPLDFLSIESWLIVFMILTYSLFSIIYINYQAYAVNLTDDYHIRTKIISFREIAFIIGIIIASLAPTILNLFYHEIESFLIIGVSYFIVISVFAIVFYKNAPINKGTAKQNLSLKPILASKKLKRFLLVFFFNAIAASIPAVIIMFFVDYILASKDFVGLFLMIYFVGLLIGVVLWTKISAILNDKIQTFLISMSLTALIFIGCFFLSEGDIILYAIICLFAGIGFGGDLCLGYSILTDIIWEEGLKQNESAIFGVTNFILKMSLAFASSVLIYGIGYFENNIEIVTGFIAFSYAVLPIVFRIFAIICLYKFFKPSKA